MGKQENTFLDELVEDMVVDTKVESTDNGTVSLSELAEDICNGVGGI